MRAYDALGEFLSEDQPLLARCRDFGVKLGYDENSPEWSYLVMPAMILRELKSEIMGQIETTVRETIVNILAEERKNSKTPADAALSDQIVKAISTHFEKNTPTDVAVALRASTEIMAPLQATLNSLNARDEKMHKYVEKLEACVDQMKKLIARKANQSTSLVSRFLRKA